MSKELRDLSNLRDKIVYGVGTYEQCLEWLDTIEQALKNYEETKKHFRALDETCCKKYFTIKAIKKMLKGYGVQFFFIDKLREIKIVGGDWFEKDYKCETQEEYDSLKEALSWQDR